MSAPPTVYLAFSSSGLLTLTKHADKEPVDLLVALPEVRSFERNRSRMNVNKWCLDSGAFSAHNSGKRITYEDWRAVARNVDACEVFGLDVIGNPSATRANLERAWSDGIAAIPTFHHGSPWDWLEWCCAHSSKVALGGIARKPDVVKTKWVGQCFARHWPHRFHGFGMASERLLQAYPFHSVDASSWAYAPGAMGAWCGFTGKQVSLKVRGLRDYWVEVREHQRRAQRAADRWSRELKHLEDSPGGTAQ